MPTKKLIIFAKTPLPGLVKTRLIPALGEQGAATLADRLIQYTLHMCSQLNDVAIEYCVAPDCEHRYWQTLPKSIEVTAQGEGDLGQRLARATERALTQYEHCVVIGTDCPAINAELINEAFTVLNTHNACINPVRDGGYALLGLSQFSPCVFQQIPWSTEQVSALTKEAITALAWSLYELPLLADIDRPEDLHLLDQYFLHELTKYA